MSNRYKHPHLLKGTAVMVEGKDSVTGEKGRIAETPIAVRWHDIARIDGAEHPELIFTAEPFNKRIMLVTFKNGSAVYLLDPYGEVLAAWEMYLNTASLGHKSLLSN